MGAQFITLREQLADADGMVAVTEHWYLTEDKSRVVREGDPDGRWLWASPGTEVRRTDALRLGALKVAEAEPESEPEAEPVTEVEAVDEAEPESVAEAEPAEAPEPQAKARRKPADKSRKPGGNK